MFDTRLQQLLDDVAETRERLEAHRLYGQLTDLKALRIFMEHHVFAVWDFMSLAKSLQRSLTCVELPWRPQGSPSTRRMINELVLEEESDVIDGVATGHFEFYLRAMEQAGADTQAIRRLLDLLAGGVALDRALTLCGAPAGAVRFTRATFDVLEGGAHEVAASFTIGRETSIPAMFNGLTGAVAQDHGRLDLLNTYLARHLELDGEDHGPKAMQMLSELCGDDPALWAAATRAALVSLEARLRLWDDIADALVAQRSEALLVNA